MKILLMTTGGTIASVITDGVIDVKPQGKLLVLKKYKEIDSFTEFDVISPINILSENVKLSDYKVIVDTLKVVDFDLYDGVIITHGSDTLAYTSALVGLLFSDINKPIAVVAADKSLQELGSNGMDNFLCAVEIIKKKMNGVYVPYRNADGVTYVHYATNLFESGILSDDFYSFGGACAMYKDGVFTQLECSAKRPQGVLLKDADLSFSKEVLQVYPYPHMDYSRIDINGIKAVLHRTYHAGSVCAYDDKNHSVTSLIERCKEQGVPFYICGLKEGKANYQTLDSVLPLSVKALYDMAPACAYMKLLIEG